MNMIKVTKIEKDGKYGRECEIQGSIHDIVDDINALFEAFTRNQDMELTFMACLHECLSSRQEELLNKVKGDK